MEKVNQTLIIEATLNGFTVTDEDENTIEGGTMSFESKDTMREFLLEWLTDKIDGNVSFDETHNPTECYALSFVEGVKGI